MRVLLIAINAKYIHSNLAVHSLKAYADNYLSEHIPDADIVIDISEYTINNLYEDVIQDIYKKKPDVLAFSTYIWNVEYILRIADTLKKILPETALWAGGPEVSYRAQKFLQDNPGFDMVMCGEGELIFSKAVVSYYETGKCESVIECESALSMDELPFIYSDIKDFEHRIIYYETSRGCPFSCSYCLSSIDKRTRFRNPLLVNKELQFFLDKKVPLVKFVDRTFNCSHEHAMGIWKFISEHDNGITRFHFELSADLLTDEEIECVSTFRKGLVQFEIGVQSFNPETLNSINRHADMEKLINNVNRLYKLRNMHIHLDLIAGLPYEDLDSFASSFNSVYALSPDELQLGFLKVLYGSEMSSLENEYGLVRNSYAPYEVLKTKWLSYDDVIILKQTEAAVETFYNSKQFECTVKYLSGLFASPFDMYRSIGEYYAESFAVGVNHSRLKIYEFLLDFARYCGKNADMELLKELLTYDIYLRENCNTRPTFAERSNDVTRKIRNMYVNNKQIHAEVFSYDIKLFISTWEIKRYRRVYLFNYESRDVITNNVVTVDITDKAGECVGEEKTFG